MADLVPRNHRGTIAHSQGAAEGGYAHEAVTVERKQEKTRKMVCKQQQKRIARRIRKGQESER